MAAGWVCRGGERFPNLWLAMDGEIVALHTGGGVVAVGFGGCGFVIALRVLVGVWSFV